MVVCRDFLAQFLFPARGNRTCFTSCLKDVVLTGIFCCAFPCCHATLAVLPQSGGSIFWDVVFLETSCGFCTRHDRTEISVRRLYKHLARCTCGSFNFSSSQTTSGHVPSTFERSRSHSFRRFVHFNFFFGISDQIYFKVLGKLFPCLGGIF